MLRLVAIRLVAIQLVLSFAAVLVAGQASAQYGGGGGGVGSKAPTILSFKTMYGVNGPFLGATNPVRGVDGDADIWLLKSAKGSLTSSGKLSIDVKGLVLPTGLNDAPEFRALVSCLAVNGGNVVETNVMTNGFPANEKGNSKIKAQLTLPQPCLAPIVMILPGDEVVWFAMTGH